MKTYAEQLREVGLRVTKPRLAILDFLSRHPHSSADAVRVAVSKALGSVSTQAVYDVLHALTEKSILRSAEPAGSVPVYELNSNFNHHHLVCRNCYEMINIDCIIGEAPCLTPNDTHDYRLDEAEVTFWGYCPKCQQTCADLTQSRGRDSMQIKAVDALFVCAMGEETAEVEKLLPDYEIHPVSGSFKNLSIAMRKTCDGAQPPAKLLLLTTGIGMVSAASSLSSVLSTFSPKTVICCGSAGGLAADTRVGEVVIGTEYVNAGADGTAFGYVPGQVPQQPAVFKAAPGLLKAAEEYLRRQMGEDAQKKADVRFGQMNSSDTFVTGENVGSVRETFPAALTTDMESQALAQVAAEFSVPFVAVRAISDLCGKPDDQSVSFHTELSDAARSAAETAYGILETYLCLRRPVTE